MSELSKPPQPVNRSRLDNIDLLRGLIMVIMALDHTRGYFSNAGVINPVDLDKTNAFLFLTRWITHYCAPNFVFLAGTGAYLAGSRGMSRPALSWFLFSRGLWLVILDLTLVHFGWDFTFDFRHPYQGQLIWFINGGIIWNIGFDMVILSVLCFLPTSAVAALGVAIVAFHNLFDNISVAHVHNLFENTLAADVGWLGSIWGFSHSGEPWKPFPDVSFQSPYGLLPCLGIMCCGYGLGALMTLPREIRRPQLIALGVTLILLFIGLRYSNLYGDKLSQVANVPGPWSYRNVPGTDQFSWTYTILSFLNCQKYPASLLYTLMTVGPGVLFLGLLDTEAGPLGRFFIIFGRVPLFYYLLHIPLIHGLAELWSIYRYGKENWQMNVHPEGWGFDLPIVYAIWIGVILILYPLCYVFAGVKSRHRNVAWLSYL